MHQCRNSEAFDVLVVYGDYRDEQVRACLVCTYCDSLQLWPRWNVLKHRRFRQKDVKAE